jgi:hypothetical protein
MTSEFHGTDWFAATLRAWQLAMLRYAVTLDNADRLAVLRIAHEIDGLRGRTAAPGSRHTAGATATADFPVLKRFCLRALTVLLAGGAVAGIIVLKTAIALSRIS